jgi:hypothetical protein
MNSSHNVGDLLMGKINEATILGMITKKKTFLSIVNTEETAYEVEWFTEELSPNTITYSMIDQYRKRYEDYLNEQASSR